MVVSKFYELIKNDLVICDCNKIMTLREWQEVHSNNTNHSMASPINSPMGRAKLRLMK